MVTKIEFTGMAQLKGNIVTCIYFIFLRFLNDIVSLLKGVEKDCPESSINTLDKGFEFQV